MKSAPMPQPQNTLAILAMHYATAVAFSRNGALRNAFMIKNFMLFETLLTLHFIGISSKIRVLYFVLISAPCTVQEPSRTHKERTHF